MTVIAQPITAAPILYRVHWEEKIRRLPFLNNQINAIAEIFPIPVYFDLLFDRWYIVQS